jgi:hypothetical protein
MCHSGQRKPEQRTTHNRGEQGDRLAVYAADPRGQLSRYFREDSENDQYAQTRSGESRRSIQSRPIGGLTEHPSSPFLYQRVSLM